MDEKTQRYMQRIDQLILTPRKGAAQARPSRSPLNGGPHALDKYLKYELSAKLIQGIVSKHHLQLMNAFFNAVRSTEFRQRERIYKFIGVEKSQKREMRVDAALAAKILLTLLKEIARKRYAAVLNALAEHGKPASHLPQTTSSKPIPRKQSTREASGYNVLMRTSTIPEKDNYRMVSEWIEDSSALEQRQNQKN